MDFVIIINTDSVGSGRLCAGTTAKRHVASSPLQFYGFSQLRRSSSVRVQFKTDFLLGEGSLSSVQVRVQFDILLLLGEAGSSSSSSVRVQFKFSSRSNSV